jgi:hypothetical protein
MVRDVRLLDDFRARILHVTKKMGKTLEVIASVPAFDDGLQNSEKLRRGFSLDQSVSARSSSPTAQSTPFMDLQELPDWDLAIRPRTSRVDSSQSIPLTSRRLKQGAYA